MLGYVIYYCLCFLCFLSNGYTLENSEAIENIALKTAADQKQQICLNMIVKDESKIIKRGLATVKPIIDYWVIVDTGSTDGTQQIIKDFMQDIPGELHERPWKNFAYNRNQALALAKGKADYILFMDADETLEFSPNFKMPTLLGVTQLNKF
jgi:glycosyltransferase involved in cell wall biosynthesis